MCIIVNIYIFKKIKPIKLCLKNRSMLRAMSLKRNEENQWINNVYLSVLNYFCSANTIKSGRQGALTCTTGFVYVCIFENTTLLGPESDFNHQSEDISSKLEYFGRFLLYQLHY